MDPSEFTELIAVLLPLLKSLGVLIVILALAFLVETIIEAVFGRLCDQIPQLQPYKWATFYLAIALGIVGAMVYSFDLIYILASYVEVEYIKVTLFGKIITGTAIGMGAAYLHQFISIFIPVKNQAAG